MTKSSTICPGCGIVLPKTGFTARSPLNASAECWEQYVNLSAYTISLGDPEFIHQHIVDAYEAQHAGPAVKPISTVFGLIGLYLALEKGYSGRRVQEAHATLANRNRKWPLFLPSASVWPMSVVDVISAREEDRTAKIRDWMKAVWDGWEKKKPQVRGLVDLYLFSR